MSDSEAKIINSIRSMTHQYVGYEASKELVFPISEKDSDKNYELQLVKILADLCSEYLERKDTGEIVLDNSCMSAGEHAFLVLEEYGLIIFDPCGFRFARWTEAGRNLLDSS